MRSAHIVIGVLGVTTTVASGIVLIIDPGPIDRTSVPLLAFGLVLASVAALAGLLLARAPWGRWGLASTVIASMIAVSLSDSDGTWVVYVLGAASLIGLFGPWLRLWVRHRPAAEAPGAIPTTIMAVAVVAPLFAGIATASSGASAAVWVAVAVAMVGALLYAQGASIGLWILRIALPAAGAVVALTTPDPSGWLVLAGTVGVSVLSWFPAARRTTAVITPPLPSPTRRSP